MTSRHHNEGWSGSGLTRAEREVVEAIEFGQFRFLAWGLNVTLVPFDVLVFWGRWDLAGGVWFSVVAAAYASYFGIRGWTPWRMAVYRTFRRDDDERWIRNPVAVAVADFFRSPRIGWVAAAICGTAILTPWLLMGLSRLVGSGHIGRQPSGKLPAMMMALLGYGDAVRAGTLAMLWMLRQLRENWDSLREGIGTAT